MKRLLHHPQCRAAIGVHNHGAHGLRRHLCRTSALSLPVSTETEKAQPSDEADSRKYRVRKVVPGGFVRKQVLAPVIRKTQYRYPRNPPRQSKVTVDKSKVPVDSREDVEAGFTWLTKDPALVVSINLPAINSGCSCKL